MDLERVLLEFVENKLSESQQGDKINHFSSTSSMINAAIATSLKKKTQGRLFVVFPHDDEVRLREKDFRYFLDENVCYLENTGSDIGRNAEITKKYIENIRKFVKNKDGIILLSLWTLSSYFPRLKSSNSLEYTLKVGDILSFEKLSEVLLKDEYIKTIKVQDEGEFALRGEVVDIFPFGFKKPVRIYLNFDKIERMSTFDVMAQCIKKDDNPLQNLKIEAYNLRDENDDEKIEYGFLTDQFTQDDAFLFIGEEKLKESWKHIVNRAKDTYREYYKEGVSKTFEEILPPLDETFKNISNNRKFVVNDIVNPNVDSISFHVDGPRSYFGAFNMFKDELKALEKSGWSSYIFASGMLQKARFESMLFGSDGEKKQDEYKHTTIINGDISEGFSISEIKLIVFSDEEIFKRRNFVKNTLSKIETSPIDSFIELKEGDLVVHINYGIARFIALERIEVQGTKRDYIKLEFKDEEFYYVPIQMANMVHRYVGNQDKAELSSLSSKSWSQKKEKARQNAEKFAEDLIELYAKRKESRAFAHSRDTEWQHIFEAGFCYPETPDQLEAISDVKRDMEAPTIMDRLICGDVGYGKTEVAFRAAFKAIMSGKQVAFIAPTTILAHQHYKNFKERVENFPITVKEVSRTVPQKELKNTIKALESGEVDIAFGTHRLLQKDIKFKNLGLLVIDEEQRFGVKDKEKIKNMKTNVDALSMSATPIPRTLYMSLLKIRDISMLKTAPIDRHSVVTYIGEYEKGLVKSAIERELSRGGQVYYLHNRVEDIRETLSYIRALIPGAIVEMAHGKMNIDELEDVMDTFVKGGIQILVSTTIIENGIDIPLANTLIVDNALIYGSSQLYQLRGRVGRSTRQAYAYFFYKNEKSMSDDAVERLRVLSENTELGSGFKVAMRDMEIRGGGNILGKEQSGFVSDVGLDLYIRLLDESVKRLEGQSEDNDEVYVDINASSFIPDTYVNSSMLKFEIYKKIASCYSEEEYESIVSSITDRYGNPPEEVLSLFYIAKLKILCKKLFISSVTEKNDIVKVEFSKVSKVDLSRFFTLMNTSGGAVMLNPRDPKSILIKTSGIRPEDKALFIVEKLSRL